MKLTLIKTYKAHQSSESYYWACRMKKEVGRNSNTDFIRCHLHISLLEEICLKGPPPPKRKTTHQNLLEPKHFLFMIGDWKGRKYIALYINSI